MQSKLEVELRRHHFEKVSSPSGLRHESSDRGKKLGPECMKMRSLLS